MAELTDIDSVRRFMQKPENDTKQNDDIEVLIDPVSKAIERYTNREFTPTNAATRSFEYTVNSSADVLDLAPYEIRTLTSAKVDPEAEGGGTALTNLQYRLRPYPPRDGTFFGLRLAGLPLPKPALLGTTTSSFSEYPFFTRRIDVTGDWGMTQIPDDVAYAANLTVAYWLRVHYRAGVAGQGQGDLLGEVVVAGGRALPPEAKDVLRSWTRPEVLV